MDRIAGGALIQRVDNEDKRKERRFLHLSHITCVFKQVGEPRLRKE